MICLPADRGFLVQAGALVGIVAECVKTVNWFPCGKVYAAFYLCSVTISITASVTGAGTVYYFPIGDLVGIARTIGYNYVLVFFDLLGVGRIAGSDFYRAVCYGYIGDRVFGVNGVRGGKFIIGGVLSVCCGGGVGLFSGVIVSSACKVSYIGYKGAVRIGDGLDLAAVELVIGVDFDPVEFYGYPYEVLPILSS